VYCANGSVKDPPGAEPEAECAEAAIKCKSGQWGSYGVCTNCGAGTVPNAARSACVYCPSGKVKDPSGAVAEAECVDAADHCLSGQWASYGSCVTCGAGTVPNDARSACVYCPNGQVKYPAGAEPAATCVAAAERCGTGQWGSYGVCTNCGAGTVPNEGRTACVYCPNGKVKFPTGAGDTAECAEAAIKCSIGQWGSYGVCTNCGSGTVPKDDRTACVYCPTGQVKHPAGSNANGVCVLAECVCTTSQWGSYGVCTSCGANTVPKFDRTGCEYCPSGKIFKDGICKAAVCKDISLRRRHASVASTASSPAP
jgi:hypothetical protein